MRIVTEEQEFERVLIIARESVFVDSGRTATELRRLVFDDAQLLTQSFFSLLQTLMDDADPVAYYCVLDPDPIDYFYCHFKRYPVVEICIRDTPECFFDTLNEDLGGSTADAIGTNWWQAVIIPRGSLTWFVHMLRSATDNGGHLWVETRRVDQLRRAFPFLRSET